MDRFLFHLLLLGWISIATAGLLTSRITDRFIAATVLAWTNLVVTSLSLALAQKLGNPDWFLGSSLLLAGAGHLFVQRAKPGLGSPINHADEQPSGWLQGAFLITVIPFALAVLSSAYLYATNNPDSLSHQLPRALFYLGQGSLAHFDAADPRLILPPFNYNLVHLFGFIYGPPVQCLNFFNVLAWAVAGTAVYRLCQLCGASASASLVVCWLMLMTTPVIAQAATTTPDLATGAAVACAFVFAALWQQRRQKRYASLAGLAGGLAAGSDLNTLAFFIGGATLLLVIEFRAVRKNSFSIVRAWSWPTLLGIVLALPFFFVNLFQGSLTQVSSSVPAVENKSLNVVLPLWTSSVKATLNEDLVGFGFFGVLLLLCASACAVLKKRPSQFVRWCACLGLGWIGVRVLLCWNTSFRPRDMLPATFLLSPCVSVIIQSMWSTRRSLVLAMLVPAMLVTGLSATVYLLDNSRRPLRPLVNSAALPPALPPLPQALDQLLSKQTWINIDADGTQESLFSLMRLNSQQRFTTGYQNKTGAYNLFSRSTSAHNAGLGDLKRLPSYTVVPYPQKPTTGVEYLATVGRGASSRSYFGLPPAANRTPSLDSNQFLLVTISSDPKHGERTRIRIAGLNPSDHARLNATEETVAGATTLLASFEEDGSASIPSIKAGGRILIKVISLDSDAELTSVIIPATKSENSNPEQRELTQAANPNLLFTTDLVLSNDPPVVVSDGLQPTEGPFPQWNLPYLRWAKKPSVTIEVPVSAELAQIKFHFSARLHVRETGGLEILFNGASVQQYRLSGASAWFDQNLEFTAQPGKNLIELRDIPISTEPDWLDYLERNPDVKKYVLSQNIPLEEGARQHYEFSGRPEGRIMKMRSIPGAENSFYFMFRNLRLEGFRSP